MEPFEIPLKPFLIFLVVLARVGGLVTFAPFFSHRITLSKVRVVIAVVLALVLTPALIEKIAPPPAELLPLALILAGEVIIGMVIGFIGRLVFLTFEMASYFVSSQMGFSLAGTFDPSTQAQTTAFGIVAQMLGLVILLQIDGHHWFLTATINSFATTAPGELILKPELLEILLRFGADALTVGLTIAAPAIIVLLSVEFGLEFFGRTAPQFQVFILGFPIKIAVGLWIIGASLYFIPNAFRSVLGSIYHGLIRALGAM